MPRRDIDAENCFSAFWAARTGEDLSASALDVFRRSSDPPDFEFMEGDELIAVEHTHLFREIEGASKPMLPPQHHLAIERRICDHVTSELCSMNCVPPLLVSITFASCGGVLRRDEPRIGAGVCNLIGEAIRRKEPLPIDLYASDLSAVSLCLGHVLVMAGGKSSSATRHAWAIVDEWGLPSIQAAATRKAGRLSSYVDSFDECWLLLGTGGAHPRQWIEPSAQACVRGVVTSFDRVFVVDESRKKLYEIQTRRT